MRHQPGERVVYCRCLACGDDADRAARILLKTCSELERSGCPRDAIAPALALSLNVVVLCTPAPTDAAHRLVETAVPRATQYYELLRDEEAVEEVMHASATHRTN
jgi:hypothetical protein